MLLLLSPQSSSAHGLQELTKKPKESLLLALGFRPPELAQLLDCGQFYSLLDKFEPGFIHYTLLTCRLTCASFRIQCKIECPHIHRLKCEVPLLGHLFMIHDHLHGFMYHCIVADKLDLAKQMVCNEIPDPLSNIHFQIP